MYKAFSYLIIIFAIILVLFSLTTFVIIQINLLKSDFSFTPKGLNFYLQDFADYNALFGATITLIIAYFGIKRLEAAETSNKDKLKLDRYNDWKIVTDIRIDEVHNLNERFRREFYKVRFNLFSDLYESNLSITNIDQLKYIFNKYFRNYTNFFEEMTEKSLRMGHIYRDEQYTFFFDSFYYIVIGSLINEYPALQTDLKKLYIESLKADRIIDSKMFDSSYRRYTGDI
ncbi:hypothetical protein [Chryseobacterium sp. KMC2]|uniref:hypothetical protein n=1 Tax=Chryseobacterium sp. KMC2 TaxID=2800705 RepID=UPI0019250B59|nr:hypothetical protein [Chryseobacterium sp. KMC2]MBL3548825.1 hypothetical protein [Chryseobacterium sp. KMC2]